MYSSLREYSEKRDFIRMNIECPVFYQAMGSSINKRATCVNLSAKGIKFHTDQVLAVGSKIHINVVPELKISPSLSAVMEILRVEPLATNSKSYYIAGKLEEIDS